MFNRMILTNLLKMPIRKSRPIRMFFKSFASLLHRHSSMLLNTPRKNRVSAIALALVVRRLARSSTICLSRKTFSIVRLVLVQTLNQQIEFQRVALTKAEVVR